MHHFEIIKTLLELKADVTVEDDDGYTPLCKAVEDDCSEKVKLLIKRGSDVRHITGYDKSSLFHLAARNGNIRILDMLKKAGADFTLVNTYRNLPFHDAARNGNDMAVIWFINNGQEVETRGTYNRTALHFAAMHGHLSTVKLLIGYGAQVNRTDCRGKTTLSLAIMNRNRDVINFLMAYGAIK